MSQPSCLEYLSLSQPPNLSFWTPKPLYHKQNSAEFIIIFPDYRELNDNRNSLIFYDILNNKYEFAAKYESNMKPESHGIVMDRSKNMLYVFFGKNKIFSILNLNNFSWDIKLKNNDLHILKSNQYFNSDNKYNAKISKHPCSVFIPSPFNELHIVDRNEHLKFNPLTQKFEYVSRILAGSPERNKHCRMVYVTLINKLMVFQCKTKSIWYLDLDLNKKQTKYDWILHLLSLPYDSNNCDIICAFGCIVFVFYYGDLVGMVSTEMKPCRPYIWLLDVLHYKWYLCDKWMAGLGLKNAYSIKTDHNYVHFISCYGAGDYRKHVKISLYPLIPKELNEEYKKMYTPLVYGYIRKTQKLNDLYNNISDDVARLILCFFPLFL